MKQASDWLVKKRRWHMQYVVWSIHHAHKKLDRAGKAAAHGFRYIQQDSLNTLVKHDLKRNNACWSVGSVWTRTNCIPIGGPFSAQGADFWRGYVHRHLFRQLGALSVSAEGFPLWDGPHGRVALCQFRDRDNILVATDAPPEKCASLVNLLRSISHKAWGLHVECDCIAPNCN